ncbi:hypothetical protein PR048_007589 [Dryococelus australis]|uniref:Mutator-like transposase domain-containing protein n=1 Tax=Dryococelus australis TaxID=614101 RepID=A0ABQ9HUM8_9NEOP|nr:hypothetical protein PR048_007589 [Dryococelus australis]
MDVIREQRFDFSSLITFKCKLSNITRTLRTEDAGKEVEVLNVNYPISPGLYELKMQKPGRSITIAFLMQFTNQYGNMAEAEQEEVRLAIQAGDVDKEDHPIISVGCIIEYKTKEVLFIGVRNKYCTVCARYPATGSGSSNPTHKCAKN